MLGDGLTSIIGDKKAAAVSAKIKHYLDNVLKTATAGSDTDKITKDLYHILNGSVGAIDHRAESFRDAMPKFSPLLGDLAFCAGAACGTVEAFLGKGKRGPKSARIKKPDATTKKPTARNRALHEKHRIDLAKQQQKRERGLVISGGESGVPLRDANRLKSKYGGKTSEWVKKTSTSYEQSNGNRIETHWYENTRTGKRYEFKTKNEWPE